MKVDTNSGHNETEWGKRANKFALIDLVCCINLPRMTLSKHWPSAKHTRENNCQSCEKKTGFFVSAPSQALEIWYILKICRVSIDFSNSREDDTDNRIEGIKYDDVTRQIWTHVLVHLFRYAKWEEAGRQYSNYMPYSYHTHSFCTIGIFFRFFKSREKRNSKVTLWFVSYFLYRFGNLTSRYQQQ